MALRTFRSNPSLGGFGSESTNLLLLSDKKRGHVAIPQRVDGDAFAQIIKELVDNAVDACSTSNCSEGANGASSTDSSVPALPKRVRVEIQTFRKPSDSVADSDSESASNDDHTDEILRVRISDNGSGMNDIQACVDPFHTSKAHATEGGNRTTRNNENSSADVVVVEAETAGRYGIGLTLCLLHAQRLVPGSCASIRSATSEHSHWTTMTCVIDTEGDSVECIPGERIAKAFPEESGTSVSLLVPVSTGMCASKDSKATYESAFYLRG
jgi:hypothetical protein